MIDLTQIGMWLCAFSISTGIGVFLGEVLEWYVK